MKRHCARLLVILGWAMFAATAAQANAPSRSPMPEARPIVSAPSAPAARPGDPARVLPLAAAVAPPVRPGPRPIPQMTPAAASASASVVQAGIAGSLSRAIASAALASLAAPVRPAGADTPRPAPRPLVAVPAVAQVSAPVASRLAVARSPLPERRQESARQRYLQNLQRAAAVRAQPAPSAITGRASGNLCGVRGIEGQTIAPIARTAQGCGVANPVRVTAVDGVRLSTAAVMECDTARALHTWVRTGVRPAVGNHGGGVVELRVAAHYVCRTRNHRPGAPISEHGKGRAIDISAIRLASGEVFSVSRGWRDRTYGPMLKAMHRAACGTFRTTLGPGSDGMHEDHFHYDTAQRRMTSAICR
jgi:hypothetical protein